MTGLLAIWADCAPGEEIAFEAWYTQEHLPERMAVPGFQVGRRYEAVEAEVGFLTTYEVASVETLHSPAYRARLEAPTPETRRIMREAFRNTNRTLCQRDVLHPGLRGAVVVTLATPEAARRDDLAGFADVMKATAVHAELWFGQEEDAGPSSEEHLRGKDSRIGACLALEYLRAPEALAAAEAARAGLAGVSVGTYRMLCELRGGPVS